MERYAGLLAGSPPDVREQALAVRQALGFLRVRQQVSECRVHVERCREHLDVLPEVLVKLRVGGLEPRRERHG